MLKAGSVAAKPANEGDAGPSGLCHSTHLNVRDVAARLASHDGHLSGAEIVNAAHNPKLLLGHQVGQDRLCLLQTRNVVTHIGDDRTLLKIGAGLLQNGSMPGFIALTRPAI